MGTLTARLRTLQPEVTATDNYTIQVPPLFGPYLGFCPVNSTSVADIARIFQLYPKTNAIRFFSATTLVSWSSPLWAAIPDTVKRIAYSTKTIQPTADINAYWSAIPQRFKGKIDWIWAHEPEQQTGGDPTPAVFRSEYQRLGQLRLVHPNKAHFGLGPCFTEYKAYHEQASWMADYGVVGAYPGVTRVGFDVYDTGYEQEYPNAYRPGHHMFSGLFAYCDTINQSAADGVLRTACVDEWGVARDDSVDPTTGNIAAAALAEQWSWFRQQPRAGSINWFNRGGCYLGDNPNDPAGRPAEFQAFQQMVAAL